MCQETVRNLSFSKMCHKSVGIVQKMCQKSVRIFKCVKIVSTCCMKMCQKSVILLPSDTFLTHFQHQTWNILGNIGSKKLSQICQKSISDTFLTHYEGNISKMFPQKSVRNVSKPVLLTDFWYIFNYAFKVTLDCSWPQMCQKSVKPIILTYFWYISNSAC